MTSISSREWFEADQPEIHLKLSDGTFIKVRWNEDWSNAEFYRAAAMSEDYARCTSLETGMESDDISELKTTIKDATSDFYSNDRAEYVADENNYGDE